MRLSVRRSSEEIVCAVPLSLGTSADICSSTVVGHCSYSRSVVSAVHVMFSSGRSSERDPPN